MLFLLFVVITITTWIALVGLKSKAILRISGQGDEVAMNEIAWRPVA
jgi:hypothetical protein